MSSSPPSAWQQPSRASRPMARLIGRLSLSGAVAAAPWIVPLLGGPTLPFVLTVGGAVLGGWAILRELKTVGGNWKGFRPPSGVTYTASEPELGATWGGALEFPDHDFENVLRGTTAGRPWTYVEVAAPGVRHRLLVFDLGQELPPIHGLGVARQARQGFVFGDLTMPGKVVGKTGSYTFPGGPDENDPVFLTAIVTPTMTHALENLRLSEWRVTGRHLAATMPVLLSGEWAVESIRTAAAQLVRIADAIEEVTGPPPPPEPGTPTTWPVL